MMSLIVAARRRATILVLEDHGTSGRVVARTLADAGFNVIETVTAAETLRRLDGEPEVVVLDVRMTDAAAVETHRRIKVAAALGAVPVLQVYPLDDSTDQRPFTEAADACLSHPFEPADLVSLVNALVRLRDSESRPVRGEEEYRAAFMAMPVPTYAWHAAGTDFVLTGWNQAALDITEGRIRDKLGARGADLFAEAANDYESCMRECLRADRAVRREISHRLVTTGQEKIFVTTFVPVQPDRVLVHTVDETERRAAERALRDSEERFRALTENGLELVSVLDANGNFLYASPNHAGVYGYAPEALVGTSAFALIDRDDLGKASADLSQILASPGAVLTVTLGVRRVDGDHRRIEFTVQNLLDHPAVRGIVCNGRDVTARYAADAELRFRAHLLDAVEQAVIATTPDGTITYWNRFAERLYGWGAAAVLGRNIAEVTPSEPSQEQAQEIMHRLARGDSWSGEFEVQSRDGRTFPAHVTDSPIRDAAGELVGIVGISEDVSERRKLEEQVRRSQRLEAVGQMAGGVAHDFNNLLTVIGANAQFVREMLPPDSGAHRELTELIDAVNRASGLTRQLLAFSRKQALAPRSLDLNAVVSDMVGLLQRLIGEDIALEIALDPDLGTVFADRGQIEQVLMNLAVNSRDAMRRGGTLSIATARVDLDEEARAQHPDIPPGPCVQLTVSDTGHGMERETLEHIFEPFFTTKEVGRGTGLGLSMVYGIVRQSGGCIWAESELGEGTVFKLLLPRITSNDESAKEAEGLRTVGGTERLLVVEDEASVRAVARRVLENLGYSVIEARNGHEALARFRQYAGAIDLIVTDTVMPEMGGRELVERLRRERPDLRALYTSGYTEDEIVRRGAAPSTDLLTKPFSAADIGAAVRAALDRTPVGS